MIVTGARLAAPPGPAGLLPLVRRALPGAAGRAALRLRPTGPMGLPARRRLLRALLQDAAETGGGAVFDTGAGEMLLLGAMAGAARRAAASLAGLAGDAAAVTLWLLPRDAAALLAWAETARLAGPDAPPAPPGADLAGLEARLDSLPADGVLRHRAILRPGAAVPERGRRLRLSRAALAAVLGPLAEDDDLMTHAANRLAARLLPGLAAWARDLPGWRLLPLPHAALPPPSAVPGQFGVLPLAAAADPALPAWREALAARGWGLALEAALPTPFDPAGLPADLLLLRWSPTLAEGPLPGRLPPDRLVLTGCDGPAALAFAARLGAAATGPATEVAA
ncbi:hypothetical protein JMJ55_20120 [Belnapia sp. T6]|uniref:Uncharacterized protein n=1 Tax=Belnapia mucosa TaxID=2804532 RepID=A0ABS1V7K2_9PROT|nr:hypothetical protein [Belnapia mucosa]MBL6457646.1 hypothetical protein [Belnapia mucosa]